MVLMVFLSCRISPLASTVILVERSPRATAVVTSGMLRTCEVRLPAMQFTLSVRSFHVPAEVTRVAREVGTEGKLGGQADVKGVAGTWKDLTDSVNFMATPFTSAWPPSFP